MPAESYKSHLRKYGLLGMVIRGLAAGIGWPAVVNAERKHEMKTVMTIAGSDCSGGAGIQADIKTITAHGLFATSVITSLTAQNTTGVADVFDVPPDFVARQIDCVMEDIPPDAIKIGMVSNEGIIRSIAGKLAEYGVRQVVVDPVMIATSGSRLLGEGAMRALIDCLLPLGTVITPNLPEAEALWGHAIRDRADMERAASEIAKETRGAVLIKGGHLDDTADDLLYDGECHWYPSVRIHNPNTHGTGCTLSSAIACGLALGLSLAESVQRAKKYITDLLNAGLDLGHGSGPLHHMARFYPLS